MINFKGIRDDIKRHNMQSKSQAEKYEATKCWSFAYLARWVVLEKGLKTLYENHNKEVIRERALAWIEYLDGKRTKAPNKIKDFSVQSRNIPTYAFIKGLLGESNGMKAVLDSNEKYRAKRNKIAHKAEEFQSEKVYLEYRNKVDDALKQLIGKLSQKEINRIKLD